MQYFKPEAQHEFAGDAMPYFHNGRFHVFWLLDKNHHQERGGMGAHQWAEKGDKQPYFVSRSDGGLLVFAGLYDHWENEGDEIYSFAVVTTTSEMSSGDDMPVILEPEEFDLWLEGKPGEVEELLRPFGGDLEVYKVDGRVAKPRENDAALTERIVG
jgi:putative SOS response-associated peptidase YedK